MDELVTKIGSDSTLMFVGAMVLVVLLFIVLVVVVSSMRVKTYKERFTNIQIDNQEKEKLIATLQKELQVLKVNNAKNEQELQKFEQTITNPEKKVITYKGDVRFSGRNKLKWIYRMPTKKEVCTDSRNLVVVDHDLEQVSYYLIDRGFDFVSILKRAKKYKDNIYLAEYQDKKYTIAVNKNGVIQSVAYFDDLDNKVQLLFKKMHYGKGKLSSPSMECKVPKNYDLIKG